MTSDKFSSSSQPIYGIQTTKDIMMPMRDGIRLATDIYLPCHGDGKVVDEKEPVPALIVRTSYDKTAPEWDDVIPFFVRRGYAFVIQDLRSRFRSEGDGHYYHTVNPWEGDDDLYPAWRLAPPCARLTKGGE